MRRVSTRRTGLLAVALLFSDAFVTMRAGAQAAPPQVALDRMIDDALRASSDRGGIVDLARRQGGVASAEAADAWLDWLPDFSVALRRRIEAKPGAETDGWRIDLYGNAVLSLEKLETAVAAGAAVLKAKLETEEAEHVAMVQTLSAVFALYVAERKTLDAREHLVLLEAMAEAAASQPDAGRVRDDLSLVAHVSELRAVVAGLEGKRVRAASRLGVLLEKPVESTGIDARLDLASTLDLIRTATLRAPSKATEIADADQNLGRTRLRRVTSQNWYVPELRTAVIGWIPRTRATPDADTTFRAEQVTGEATVAFQVRPAVPSLRDAGTADLERRQALGRAVSRTREEVAARAQVTLDSGSRLLRDAAALDTSTVSFEDASGRFARGERTATELAEASRGWLADRLERESIFEETLSAQIVLSSVGRGEMGAVLSDRRRKELTAAEVNRRAERTERTSEGVAAACADAERAWHLARSESFGWRGAIEAGVVAPLYRRGATDLEVRSEPTSAGTGIYPVAVREVSLLTRWSVNLFGRGARARAAESEAHLAATGAELERKRFLWSFLSARMGLAYARSKHRYATAVAAWTLERWGEQRRWLGQGLSSEADARRAARTHQAATIERERASSLNAAAEMRFATLLGEEGGAGVAVDETPAEVDAWARGTFIPDHALRGFEIDLSTRVAELERDAARSRTQALVSPPTSTTLTAQATQGLRGGSFSITAAVGVAFDPPRETWKVLSSVERTGVAEARVATIGVQLEKARVRANEVLAEGGRIVDAEIDTQRRLTELIVATRAEQAGAIDFHAAGQHRAIDALELALLQSKARRIEAEERKSVAALELVALGGEEPLAHPPTAETLESASSLLVERDARVLSAEGGWRAVERHGAPIPIAAGLHLTGPMAAGSYGAIRVRGPSTNRTVLGSSAVAVTLGLDEAVAFLGAARQREAALQGHRAARLRARLDVLRAIGSLWTALELQRLAARETEELRRYLTDSLEVRFRLASVTVTRLAAARQDYARAKGELVAAEARAAEQKAELAVGGVAVGDSVLAEYARAAEGMLHNDLAALLPKLRQEAQVNAPALLEARARTGAATASAAGSALEWLSPISGLVEGGGAHTVTEAGRLGEERRSFGSDRSWILSLVVPVKPREVGGLAIGLAHARFRKSEDEAVRREVDRAWVELEVELETRRSTLASAEKARLAAAAALADIERRYRAGTNYTSIDDLERAKVDLFGAERVASEAKGAALAVHAELRALVEAP